MKTFNKLLATITLAVGLLAAPVLDAYGVSGAVLKNEKTGHIVRLIGDNHTEKYDEKFSKSFMPQLSKYFQSDHSPIGISEACIEFDFLGPSQPTQNTTNIKHEILEKMHLVSSGKSDFFKKINNFSSYDIRSSGGANVFCYPFKNILACNIAFKYQSKGLFANNGQLNDLIKLIFKSSLSKNNSTTAEQIKRFQYSFLMLRFCQQKIDIDLILKSLLYSTQLKDTLFTATLKKYEKIIEEVVKTLPNVLQTMPKLTDKSEEQLTFIYAMMQQCLALMIDFADYGFLGKIAQAAQNKQEILIYAGSTHTANIKSRLIELGYNCLYKTKIDPDKGTLNKQECAELLFAISNKTPHVLDSNKKSKY